MADDIDINAEIEEIEAGMEADNAAYWDDNLLQERYGQLLAAKESGSPAPAGPDAATARRAEIETLMADPRSKYWRGSRSEAIQAEYRDLIAVDGEPGAPAPADQAVALSDADVSSVIENVAAMGEVGAAWAEELGRGGGKEALEHAEDVRLAILGDLGAAAGEIAQAFDTLDDNVRVALHRELANPYVPQLPPADGDALAQFGETGAGEILAKEWGDDAARRLNIALYRWNRLTENLDDAEFDSIDDFFRNRLRTHERAAVLRRLAA